ncbi:unnamed protein product [Effrenium voratum]|nr:unnamed protein product [Effrenium voratum]
MLQWLEACGADLSLRPQEAQRLTQKLGPHLGGSCRLIARPFLEDALENPLDHAEHIILATAQALRSQLQAPWPQLAEVLRRRWTQTPPASLAASMQVMPRKLVAAPNALRQALLASCEENPFAFQEMPLQHLCAILEEWQKCRVPVPLALRLLWLVAADRHVLRFTSRQLVMACRLASAEDVQDLELPEEMTSDPPTLALQWFDRWLDSVLANLFGWAFCREALREVLAWQRRCRRRKLPDQAAQAAAAKVLQVVVERLGTEELRKDLDEVPTELLLDLLALEASGLEDKLIEELTRRVQRALQKDKAVVPMATAVRIACGRTPVPCPRGSLLWSALASSIASQIISKREVDAFGACRPRPDLWDAVALLKAGSWQSLELQLRRPSS